MQSAIDYIQ